MGGREGGRLLHTDKTLPFFYYQNQSHKRKGENKKKRDLGVF
jgi:hypothetical protein